MLAALSAQATHSNTRWSLGVLIGLPFTALLALALLIALALIVFVAVTGEGVWFGVGWGAVWLGVTALCFFLIGVLAYWPWSSDYHKWQPHEGTITSISSRFISAGDKGGTNQRFVVTLQGESVPYSCDDTRCALLKKGDFLALSCKKAFQWSGSSGFDCNYVEASRP